MDLRSYNFGHCIGNAHYRATTPIRFGCESVYPPIPGNLRDSERRLSGWVAYVYLLIATFRKRHFRPLAFLQEVQTCYNGSTAPCTSTAVRIAYLIAGCNNDLPWIEADLQSKIGISPPQQVLSQLTEEDDYGFGAGAPGSLLRKKLITIQTVGVYQAFQKAQIQDGSGNIMGQTAMTFDQGGVTATTGTPQHTNPTVGRGNPTEIQYNRQSLAANHPTGSKF